MPDLKDRLAYLTYREACKLLGPEGERLIRQGGSRDIDIGEQVTWGKTFSGSILAKPLLPSRWDRKDRKCFGSPAANAQSHASIWGPFFP